MAFKVNRQSEVSDFYVPEERLWLTADRARIVAEDDPDAAHLFATPSSRITADDAERYGLVGSRKPAAADEDGESAGDGTELNATEGAVAFAAEQGVDLGTVTGTGKDGRITKGDVEAALESE